MCGRYYIADGPDEAEIKKVLDQIDERQRHMLRSGEIFPAYHAPIIKDQGIHLLEWGFPKFGTKGVIINARSETAVEKPMFGKSLRERRCAIPCSGFFEWQKRDVTKPKTKYLFTSNEQPVMYFAGIWNEYKNDNVGRFVILTRDANVSIADIHDRMPVILYQQEVDDWINDDKFIDFVFCRDSIVLNRKEALKS